MNSGGDSHWTWTQRDTNYCTSSSFTGIWTSVSTPFFLFFQEAWALTLPSWIRCRPYLFLWILVCLSVCVCVCACVCEGKGGGPLYVALYIKKRTFMKKVGVAWTPHRDWVWVEASEAEKEKKIKYIYNSILCRIFIGLLCHWSHALHWPCPALSTMWSLYIVLYWWPVANLIVFSCQVHFSQ